jgi:hypothetical protein
LIFCQLPLISSTKTKELILSLTTGDLSQLHRIIGLAKKLVAKHAPKKKNGAVSSPKGKRVRRAGKELVQFRKLLKAQRRKGVPVAQLARMHGVSSAYIYMLP